MSVSTELWSCDCAITCLVVMWLCHYLLGGHVTVPLPSWWSCDCAITFLVVMWLCHYLLGGHVTVPLPAWCHSLPCEEASQQWLCSQHPGVSWWSWQSPCDRADIINTFTVTHYQPRLSSYRTIIVNTFTVTHYQPWLILQRHHRQYLYHHPLSTTTIIFTITPLSASITFHHHPTSVTITFFTITHCQPPSLTIIHHQQLPPYEFGGWGWGWGGAQCSEHIFMTASEPFLGNLKDKIQFWKS